MSKITVETTGSFMLIDRTHGHQEIAPVGPTTLPLTPFVERKLREGQLRRLEDAFEPEDDATETPPARAARGRRSQ